jgi:hypothetical protein
MTTTETDRLVKDYVRRLRIAAYALPRTRRRELVGEIREHLDAALAETAPGDEVAVRSALERLGPPEEIVRAADEPRPPRRSGWLEIVALVFLILPGGWFAGMPLVALSRVWSAREKVAGIALALVPALFFFVAWRLSSPEGGAEDVIIGYEPVAIRLDTDASTWLGFLFTALTVLSGLPSALYLGWKLHQYDRRVAALSGTR